MNPLPTYAEKMFQLHHIASQQAAVETGGFAQLIVRRVIVVELVGAVGGVAAEGLDLSILKHQGTFDRVTSVHKTMQGIQYMQQSQQNTCLSAATEGQAGGSFSGIIDQITFGADSFNVVTEEALVGIMLVGIK